MESTVAGSAGDMSDTYPVSAVNTARAKKTASKIATKTLS